MLALFAYAEVKSRRSEYPFAMIQSVLMIQRLFQRYDDCLNDSMINDLMVNDSMITLMILFSL